MTKNFDDQNLEEELNKKPASDEDDDQNFIKKDSKEAKEDIVTKAEEELQGVVDDLKKMKDQIRPASNQQRNLDREVGGLEEGEQKENSEKDVWDDRSEEVDKMGSTDTFNTTGMKSVVWKQKQNRLKAKKLHEQGVDAAAAHGHKGKGEAQQLEGLGLGVQKQSFTQRVQQLKQDRSHETEGGMGM